MSEEKDILKCTSLEEAVRFLRAKESNPKLSLRKYRKIALPVGLEQMVGLIAVTMVGIAIVTALEGTDEE